MAAELLDQTLTELAKTLRNRTASPVELMTAVLDRIAATHADLNAFVALHEREPLLAEARAAEAAVGVASSSLSSSGGAGAGASSAGKKRSRDEAEGAGGDDVEGAAPREVAPEELDDAIRRALSGGATPRTIAAELSREHGVPRRDVYARALALRGAE